MNFLVVNGNHFFSTGHVSTRVPTHLPRPLLQLVHKRSETGEASSSGYTEFKGDLQRLPAASPAVFTHTPPTASGHSRRFQLSGGLHPAGNRAVTLRRCHDKCPRSAEPLMISPVLDTSPASEPRFLDIMTSRVGSLSQVIGLQWAIMVEECPHDWHILISKCTSTLQAMPPGWWAQDTSELAKTNKCPIPDLFVALVTLPPGGRSLAVPDQPCLPSFGRSAASAGEARLPPGVPSHSATPGRSIQSIVCTYLPAYGHAFRT
ncbi:hypothetical protein BJ166DRAFT_245927 [Pestalotiopsis sp. NC0098]|nr:hypothetical protein BJ166DRAFT_245927 [Pestalotiopsis sp. NC0098]